MNTEEAIKGLEKVGIKVDFISRGKYRVWNVGGRVWMNGDSEFWSGREIVKLVRMPQDSSSMPRVKKGVKAGDKVNRRIVRDAIKTEKFEDIPQNGQPFKDDRWNYD